MKKIGLALSGGGFRASLFHLGLFRFLRAAGILSQVTHITSVSGGSIFAAHLVLNWERYNGSVRDFETAAAEILSVVRLDIRNRITRRFLRVVHAAKPRKRRRLIAREAAYSESTLRARLNNVFTMRDPKNLVWTEHESVSL